VKRPVCVKCQRELLPFKNGVVAHQLKKNIFDGNKTKLAKELLKNDKDYKIWHADMFKCPVCGIEVITHFGSGPVAEHFQDDFDEHKEKVDIEYF